MPREAATRQRALAFDTCFARCAVALVEQRVDGVDVVASQAQDMTRGHAAMLAPMIEQALRDAGWRASDLDLVALTIGPGSFTGVRIGIAMARGLAISLRCPVAGIATSDALFLGVTAENRENVIIAIGSGRGDYFASTVQSTPFATNAESLAARLGGQRAILVGDGAGRLAEELRQLGVHADVGISPPVVDAGRLGIHALSFGVAHWAALNARDGLPRPIYLRGAEVTLAGGMRTTADIGG